MTATTIICAACAATQREGHSMPRQPTGPRVGFAGLDTSHPASFVPLLRERGYQITAVHDRGTVRGDGYAEYFARRHGIPTVCADVTELAGAVDIAVIGGADWDRRAGDAEPLVAAGVSLLLDKPLAGRMADLSRYRRWARAGARIGGGSALRWCAEAREWRGRHRGGRFVLSGCAGHPLDYGVHAYALALALLGPGVRGVRLVDGDSLWRVELRWPDGRRAEIAVDTHTGPVPFFATVVAGTAESDAATSRVEHLVPEFDGLYPALLDAMMPYLAGRAPAPVTIEELLEPETLALAALASQGSGGAWVDVDDNALADARYDGAAFAARYAPHSPAQPSTSAASPDGG